MISGAAFFWPLRSTVSRSKGAERRALSGIGALATCEGVPDVVVLAGILPLATVGAALGVFDVGRVAVEAVVAPPLLGGTTMAEAARTIGTPADTGARRVS